MVGVRKSPFVVDVFSPWCGLLQTLTTLLQTKGVFEGTQDLVNKEGDVCLNFAFQYFLAQVLLIVAAAGVVFINTVLKVVLAAGAACVL